jgi:hypothetical protein
MPGVSYRDLNLSSAPTCAGSRRSGLAEPLRGVHRHRRARRRLHHHRRGTRALGRPLDDSQCLRTTAKRSRTARAFDGGGRPVSSITLRRRVPPRSRRSQSGTRRCTGAEIERWQSLAGGVGRAVIGCADRGRRKCRATSGRSGSRSLMPTASSPVGARRRAVAGASPRSGSKRTTARTSARSAGVEGRSVVVVEASDLVPSTPTRSTVARAPELSGACSTTSTTSSVGSSRRSGAMGHDRRADAVGRTG